MKSLIVSVALAALASPLLAQQSAMEIAVSQNACGDDAAIVSARFLEDGRVGVRCSGAVAGASCVPIAGAGPATDSARRALQIARNQNACDDRGIVNASFQADGTILVQCRAAGVIVGDCPAGFVAAAGAGAATAVAGATVATNVVPALGGLFAVVLGAAAIGNESSTSDTQ